MVNSSTPPRSRRALVVLVDRNSVGAIVVAFFALLLVLMYLGWRNRKRKQSAIPTPVTTPTELGEIFGSFDGQYVATTLSGQPLERVAVGGLGFRANARVVVAETGVAFGIPGAGDPFIPADALKESRTATWTIDRVVEEDGLQLLGWTLGDAAVDSYFRLAEPAAFEQAIERLLAVRDERKTS